MRFSSLKIPANGYAMKGDCDSNTSNSTCTTIGVEAEKAVFTFFSFPISISAGQLSSYISCKSIGTF